MDFLQSTETEQSVIGTLIIDEQKRENIYKLSEEHFSNPTHKFIYKSIKKLYDSNKSIDTFGLSEELKRTGYNIPITLILTLSDYAMPHTIDQQIKILEDKRLRRKTYNMLNQAMLSIAAGEENITGFNSTLASKLDNLTENKIQSSDDMKSLVNRLMNEFDKQKSKQEINKYLYGIKELDNLTAGLQKQEVTTIAAKSGVGKTALALQIAKRISTRGLKVLFISREMSDIQIGKRIIASMSEIDSYKLKTNEFNEKDWKEVTQALTIMKRYMNLHINTECSTVLEIKNRLRQIKADILIIDYLQLLTPDQSEGNREREVAKISREIKNMSQDFNIPIIQLSQLNDESKDSRPTGERDMRESKAIYQNSNNVIFIHKPNSKEIERIETQTKGAINEIVLKAMEEKNIKLVEIILAKQRDGMAGRFLQYYVADKLSFRGIDLDGTK